MLLGRLDLVEGLCRVRRPRCKGREARGLMDLAMRQGYGACALPLCGGGRLLLRRSEPDQSVLVLLLHLHLLHRLLLRLVRLLLHGFAA